MMIPRVVHEVFTKAEPRSNFLFRAVIERILDFDTIRVLRLRATNADDTEAFRYEAGQWVDFIIPGVPTVGGYSFVSSPMMHERLLVDNPSIPFFDLAVKKSTHAPAAWVHSSHCAVNAHVDIKVGGRYNLGQLGHRQYYSAYSDDDAATNKVLFVAGGVGINPLYSMLLEMSCVHSISPQMTSFSPSLPRTPPPSSSSLSAPFSSPYISCLLVWSVRSLQDAAFLLPQLSQLAYDASDSGQLQVILTVTGGEDEVADQSLRHKLLASKNIKIRYGRIDTTMLSDSLAECDMITSADRVLSSDGIAASPRISAFVCGPPLMTTAVVDMLRSRDLRFDDSNIHTEKWW